MTGASPPSPGPASRAAQVRRRRRRADRRRNRSEAPLRHSRSRERGRRMCARGGPTIGAAASGGSTQDQTLPVPSCVCGTACRIAWTIPSRLPQSGIPCLSWSRRGCSALILTHLHTIQAADVGDRRTHTNQRSRARGRPLALHAAVDHSSTRHGDHAVVQPHVSRETPESYAP
jgi:hypothetical protein